MKYTFIALLVSCVICAYLVLDEKPNEVWYAELTALSAPGKSFSKMIPYLRAAIALQELGKAEACNRISKLAVGDPNGRQLTILCRMLFVGKSFRAPIFGEALCLGETTEDDWPLLPIEIVEGIPFFVVEHYSIVGRPEGALEYLEYCIENCEWRESRYVIPTDVAAERALNILFDSPKWKTRLSRRERDFLASQLKH